MATATATGFTSSLSGLPDQVLLAHTRSLRPARAGAAARRPRPPARDPEAPPAPAPRLLQPVRLRGARTGLQRRRRLAPHQSHAPVRRDRRHPRAAAGRLAHPERGGAVAEHVRSPAARCHRRGAPRLGTRGTEAAAGRHGDGAGGCFQGRGSGARATGRSATGAGAGRGAAAGAGGAGERQEHPRGEAVVGRGGSRGGAAG